MHYIHFLWTSVEGWLIWFECLFVSNPFPFKKSLSIRLINHYILICIPALFLRILGIASLYTFNSKKVYFQVLWSFPIGYVQNKKRRVFPVFSDAYKNINIAPTCVYETDPFKDWECQGVAKIIISRPSVSILWIFFFWKFLWSPMLLLRIFAFLVIF